MRGFKKDLPATIAAHFADPRSFVSLPKLIVGECTEPKAHLVLYGKVDVGWLRAKIFRLDRLKNGGDNRCWKCGRRVFENQEMADWNGAGYTFWATAEWHHIRHAPGTRCDCPENGAVSCPDCHRKEHR